MVGLIIECLPHYYASQINWKIPSLHVSKITTPSFFPQLVTFIELGLCITHIHMPAMSLFHCLRTITATDTILLHIVQVYVQKMPPQISFSIVPSSYLEHRGLSCKRHLRLKKILAILVCLWYQDSSQVETCFNLQKYNISCIRH